MSNRYLEKLAALSDLSSDHLEKRRAQLHEAFSSHSERAFRSGADYSKISGRQDRVLDRTRQIDEVLSERRLTSGQSFGQKLDHAIGKMVGYHPVYHGTTEGNAQKILKNGLARNQAPNSLDHASQLHNRVFITKHKPVADVFSLTDTGRNRVSEALDKIEDRRTTTEDMLREASSGKYESGKVLKARIPDSYWRHAKTDQYMPPDFMGKYQSAHINKDIPARYFKPSSVLEYVKPGRLSKYIRTNPNRAKEGLSDLKRLVLGLKKK